MKHVLMVGDVLKCLLELRAPLAVDGMRVGSARETYSDLLVTFPGKVSSCGGCDVGCVEVLCEGGVGHGEGHDVVQLCVTIGAVQLVCNVVLCSGAWSI